MPGPLPSFPSEPVEDAKAVDAHWVAGGVGGDESATADAGAYQRWSPVEEFRDLKATLVRSIAR